MTSFSPLPLRERLRNKQLQLHQQKEQQDEDVCCCICYEDFTQLSRGQLDCCEHLFCFECISEWARVRNNCPMCNRQFHEISCKTERGEWSVKVKKRKRVLDEQDNGERRVGSARRRRRPVEEYDEVVSGTRRSRRLQQQRRRRVTRTRPRDRETQAAIISAQMSAGIYLSTRHQERNRLNNFFGGYGEDVLVDWSDLSGVEEPSSIHSTPPENSNNNHYTNLAAPCNIIDAQQAMESRRSTRGLSIFGRTSRIRNTPEVIDLVDSECESENNNTVNGDNEHNQNDDFLVSSRGPVVGRVSMISLSDLSNNSSDEEDDEDSALFE